MLYLLNSPVLTAYGDWTCYGPRSVEAARQALTGGFTSAIGHEGAARLLGLLLEMEVPVNRIAIAMQPGDQALVLRLLTRIPEGAVLDAEAMRGIPWELGLLTLKQAKS